MRKLPIAIGAAMLLIAGVSLLPGGPRPDAAALVANGAEEPVILPAMADPVPPAVHEWLRQPSEAPNQEAEVEFHLAKAPQAVALKAALAGAGGELLSEGPDRLVARLSVQAIETVVRAAEVTALGVNQELSLESPKVATQNQSLVVGEAANLIGMSQLSMGVPQFRTLHGAAGTGVVVAVIDSGIDPVHPALQLTSDGRPKVTDWKDFTGEGLVKTPYLVAWEGTYTAPNARRYTLPVRPDASQSGRFGFWDEFSIHGGINRDLDRNGLITDRFGVLLVDAVTPGLFDTVYVDTNNDGSFADETPMKLYRTSRQANRMGRPPGAEDRRLGFVVADLDPTGNHVTMGFDGQGHGTQVAGVLGAHQPDGVMGVAPGVQLMALKALRSTGTGNWFDIKQAIRYAAQNGAHIINISIGQLAAAARWDSGASEELNQIARQYGVLIVLASDNSGPGLSSGATLGSPTEVLAVGSYYSPAMWERDFGSVLAKETIWAQSGMGPRADGSYLPSVVAPGGSPTVSPLWLHPGGYTTKVGTSIAAPHASGAAALLMEVGRTEQINSDWLSIKRALEMGARQLSGFGLHEQGHGLIDLEPARVHLGQITSVLGLQARTGEGHGGLLARSYHPGSTSFVLTNLGGALARVSIGTSDSWINPDFSSMTLPPGIPRELPLRLTPPPETGLHSAFVTLTHEHTYGPSVTVPITYVRPIDLSLLPENRHAVTERLEVGRYQRYFFAVKPGASSFSVSSRVLLSQQDVVDGSVQVQVFRPDGQAVHRAAIGRLGTGLSTLFQTTDPVPGTWEVVVTAEPEPRGGPLSAGYSLEARTRAGALSVHPLQLNVAAGSTTTHTLRFTNIYGPFTGQVQAVGLSQVDSANAWNLGVPWRVEKSLENKVEDFTLREFTSHMRVEIDNPIPSTAKLDLYLYYLDPVEGWKLRGKTSKGADGKWVIEAYNLPSGTYSTHVDVSETGGVAPRFQYRRLMAVEGYSLTVADPVRDFERNESWTANLTIRAPIRPGRYIGQVLIRDTAQGAILGWHPLEVSVGQPVLSIEPLVTQLRPGHPGNVVFELRSTPTGSLVEGTITVNGVRYVSRDGRVRVPVTPQGNSYTAEVGADLPAYQYVKRQFTLPVLEAWSFHPLGTGDPSLEQPNWREKMILQLSDSAADVRPD